MLPAIMWTITENATNAIEHNASEYFSRFEKSGGGVVIVNVCRARIAEGS